MNVERLHAIVLAVNADLESSRSVGTMGELRDALNNQVSSPQEPSHQQQTGTAYETLQAALVEAASNRFSPTWVETIEELGFANLLGTALSDRVEGILSSNQVTLSIAAEQVSSITADLEQLNSGLGQLLAGLSHFEIGSEQLAPGTAEVGVLMPRFAVDDRLRGLGEELVDLERHLVPFTELPTGSRSPLTVTTISSSDFGVFVEMVPEAAAFLAFAVERVIAAYKNVLDIRLGHQQLRDAGVTVEQLSGVEDAANSKMGEAIDEVVDQLLGDSGVSDDGRRNELRTELGHSLNALANRIDKGYNIDVRAGEPDTDEGEIAPNDSNGGEPYRVIRNASEGLRFVNRTGQPILHLPEGNPPESDSPQPTDS